MGDGAPLRVVMVSFEFPPHFGGGIGTCTRVLSRALANRGHEVVVVTVGEGADSVERVGGGVLRTIRLGEAPSRGGTLRSWWAWSEMAAAWLLGEGRGADVIEFPDYRGEGLAYLSQRTARAGGEAAAGEGGACIVRLHTPLAVLNRYNTARRRDRVLEAMEIEALLLADGVVSSSHALTREVRGLVPEVGEVEFSRYGVDEGCAAGPGADREGEGAERDVVYIGRLEERKGVEVLVRAAGPVLRACPGAMLHLVGGDTEWGPGEPSTRARLEAMLGEPERGRVVFHGAVEPRRVREIVGSARVCVFPSLFEAGPYTCLEAMAQGKAVIGTGSGGMAEMIEDGASGVIVPAGDADALAAGLIALLGRGDGELAAMGERARRRVLERYSADAAAAEAEAAYRRVLARRASGRRPGAAGLAGLLGELRGLERSRQDAADRVAELESVKDRLWGELRDAVRERDEAGREASRLAAAWEELRGRVVELEGVRDRLWEEAQRLSAERDDSRAEAGRLASEWEAAAARVRELSAEVERTGAELNEARGERSLLRDRLSRLERAVEASQTQPVFKVLAKAGLVRRVGAEGRRHG